MRRPGRPRSERAEQAIIDATIEALGECGIDGVHCEDVAARAGVGKATLYRRWAGKEDLLIAAFAAMKHPLPQPRCESVREDLIVLLTGIAADADDPRFAQQYALLHGAEERYPRLVARYKEEVVEPRRDLVRAVLRRGVETGELRHRHRHRGRDAPAHRRRHGARQARPDPGRARFRGSRGRRAPAGHHAPLAARHNHRPGHHPATARTRNSWLPATWLP